MKKFVLLFFGVLLFNAQAQKLLPFKLPDTG